MNDVWFQTAGVTCNTSHATINLLRQTFDGRLIIQNGYAIVRQEAAI